MQLIINTTTKPLYNKECAKHFRESLTPTIVGAARHVMENEDGSYRMDAPGIFEERGTHLSLVGLYGGNLDAIKFGAAPFAFSQSCRRLDDEIDEHIIDNELNLGFYGFYHPDVVIICAQGRLHALARQQATGIEGNYIPIYDDEPEREAVCVWIEESLGSAERIAAAKLAERVLDVVAEQTRNDDAMDEEAEPLDLEIKVVLD